VGEARAVDLIQAAGIGAIQTLLSRPPQERDPELPEAIYAAVLDQILTDAPRREEDPRRGAALRLRGLVPRLDVLSPSEQALMTEWLDRIAEA
jgi:hypothetical protein